MWIGPTARPNSNRTYAALGKKSGPLRVKAIAPKPARFTAMEGNSTFSPFTAT